ncbi:hypothetical protein C7S14_6495 [Burkholderia cepacia]|nr:hypothetical protein [Burkholderia cepacia]QOH32724.1 hypothetical protein C7S14_6495 [Burkholderia cepacia]
MWQQAGEKTPLHARTGLCRCLVGVKNAKTRASDNSVHLAQVSFDD